MSQSPPATNPLTGIQNPFDRTVVPDPWDETSQDVERINQAAFEKCLALIDNVRARVQAGQAGSTSLVLTGEPGTGKTHLLSRLRRHLDLKMGAGGETLDHSAVFIGIRLHTTPGLLWRHFRRETMSSLLRIRGNSPPLLYCILSGPAGQRIPQVDNLNLATALEAYRDGRHILQMSAWLRGETLPASTLERLSLSADDSDEVEQDSSYRIVEQLCRLLHPLPIVFCLDQIEAIQSHPSDDLSLVALAKAVTELHDRTQNVLIVSCIQTTSLDFIERVVRGAYADRMLKQNQALLERLNWDDAYALIQSRMTADETLRELQADRPKLWPLSERDLKTALDADGKVAARQLLYRARELFDKAAGDVPAEFIPVEDKLRNWVEGYREVAEAHADAFDRNNSLSNGLPLLLHLSGIVPQASQAAQQAWLDLSWAGRQKAGLVLCNQENMTALANRLKKINERWQPPAVPRLFLVRDERLGISKGAKACHAYLRSLQDKGTVLLTPSAEAVAALEALRRLLAEAQSGDLSHNGETIAPEAVENWMKKNLPPALSRLLEVLLGDEAQQPPKAETLEMLTDYLVEHCVAPASEAAAHLQIAEGELVQIARDHSSRFGFLEGPPAVLFRLASASV